MFLNLVRGNRITNYIGLSRVDAAQLGELSYGPQYMYIELPAVRIETLSAKGGEDDSKGSRNQAVLIHSAFQIQPRGNSIVYVEPARELSKWGAVQPGFYCHPVANQEPIPVGITVQLRKDIELAEVPYVARIYLVGV